MKQPTRLTRVLQVAFPAFVIGSAIVAWGSALGTISTRLASGETFAASYIAAFLGVWTVIALVLAYGSLKTWGWAFWGNVLLALFSFAVPPRGSRFGWLAYISDAILIVLIALAAVAFFRDGTWGMKRSSATQTP
jgi:hypothetical protein